MPDDPQLDTIRLTTAEILAYAVCDLFPQTQLVAAHVTQEGFFCDFATPQPIDAQALPLIEERMRGITKADLPIETREMMSQNAAELFRHRGLPFQAEKALSVQASTVFVLHLASFCDLILEENAILPSTGACRAFKILEIERAERYSEDRGDYPVVRIRGTVCSDLPTLKQWLKAMKAARKSDHRIVGEHLKLFCPGDALFPGSWCWLPKGVELCEALWDFWKSAVRGAGYQIVSTPALVEDETGEMEIEGRFYSPLASKALAHALLFNEGSYAECATLYQPIPREEREGLLKTSLQAADALHLFCNQQEAAGECISSLQFFDKTLKMLSFEPLWVLLDSRPIHSPVRQADWRLAVQLLNQGLEGAGIRAERHSQPAGMHGPLLEARVSDALGRKWAVATWGIDAVLPRLREGKAQVPVMFRGSLFGSVERVVALLLENGVDINRLLRRAIPG